MANSAKTYDVLIAGGGNAAMCAAITAARRGARVIVVEKAPKLFRGGNTRHTRNMRVAHERANRTLTGPYPVAEFLDDLEGVTQGNTSPELARLALESSAELWDFMETQGVRFQPSLEGTLSLSRTNAFFLGGGRTMLNALYRTAEQLGVDIHYETELVDVATDGGLFKSATVRQHGEARQIAARSFVAASGGFEANIAWLKEAWGDAAENFLIRGTPYNTGTVLKQLIDRGFAQVGDSKQCHAVAIDGRAPKFDGGIVTRLDCVPFGVVLNASAQRFYDEGQDFWPNRYAIWGRLVAEQPGQVAYVFIDSKSIDRFMPSIFPPLVAGMLGELAEQLGLDPDQTQRTITEFNIACLPGTFDPTGHDDCRTQGLVPPKSHWARPLDRPPYYAYPLRPGITFTYLGLKVNRAGQLLRADSGQPSPNMFAAGEIMAGNILGQGYLAGIGMTIGSVFGRIAGEGAARYARN